MNVDTDQPGTREGLLKPGERTIPDPQHPNCTTTFTTALTYGTRRPLREVRAELQAQKAAEASE